MELISVRGRWNTWGGIRTVMIYNLLYNGEVPPVSVCLCVCVSVCLSRFFLIFFGSSPLLGKLFGQVGKFFWQVGKLFWQMGKYFFYPAHSVYLLYIKLEI